MQDIALIVSIILMAVVAAAFLWVAGAAGRSDGDGAVIARKGFLWRGRLFWLAVVAGTVISFATLWNWPIAGHAAAREKPDMVVKAVAHQWRWELERDTVELGKLIEFEVTASDVNHGFAIYKDKTRIIAQTQAMPGYTNRLRVRFTEPGEYEVLCLEYCGLAHHGMRAVIKVSAAN